MYATLFDFSAPCPQTKILIFQGTLKGDVITDLNHFALTRLIFGKHYS